MVRHGRVLRRAAPFAALLAWVGVVSALPSTAASLASDLAQLLVSAVAAVSAGHVAVVRAAPSMRATWGLLSAACGSWCAGQGYWTWAAATDRAVPFPSAADAGFLGFAVLAGAALLAHPARAGSVTRWRHLWDAVMTAGAVGLVAWRTSLSAVMADSAGLRPGARLLLLAYPVTDVALVVLTVLLLARPVGHRAALTLVGAGLLVLSVGDSAFVYATATASYEGGLIDLGWIGGFTLLALAGRTCAPASPADEDPRPRVGPTGAPVLIYLPVAAASLVVLLGAAAGRPLSPGEQVVAVLVVAALLARQYLAVRDNHQLAAALTAREEQLQRQVVQDPLTGLANRRLLTERLEHAVRRRRHEQEGPALLFLDLDDFKGVNDTLGHAVGDRLLIEVATRLVGAVRGADTVARLGGDEFAVLLAAGSDPTEVAARLHHALRAPVLLEEHRLTVRASIGVCAVAATDESPTPAQLLARADAAMYAAKRAGKDRVRSSAAVVEERPGGATPVLAGPVLRAQGCGCAP
ncbi:diguanylate cyclase domain-containing protein [Geodermatophilus nigrescens]